MYKITQSLLSSWAYFMNAEDEQSSKAYESFLKSLRREQIERTDAMQRGIDFEDKINTYVDTLSQDFEADDKERRAILEIADIVGGGIPQLYSQKIINVAGDDVKIYGYLDYLKAGTIYDIKRVQSYQYGKYFGSPQHTCYLEMIGEAINFKYLIFDGSKVHVEEYKRGEIQSAESMIFMFYTFLKENDLWRIYEQHWSESQD